MHSHIPSSGASILRVHHQGPQLRHLSLFFLPHLCFPTWHSPNTVQWGTRNAGSWCLFLPVACTVAVSEQRLTVTFSLAHCPISPPGHRTSQHLSETSLYARALDAPSGNILLLSSVSYIFNLALALSIAFKHNHTFIQLKTSLVLCPPLTLTFLSPLSSGTRMAHLRPFAYAVPQTWDTWLPTTVL